MGSASLSKPSSSQVTQITAVSTYSASGFSLPSNSEYWLSDTSYYLYSYSGLTYSWEFSDGGSSSSASGAHTFTGLSLGTNNILSATVTVSCTQSTTYYAYVSEPDLDKPILDEEGNPTGQYEEKWYWTSAFQGNSSYSLGSATASITIYTQPSKFSLYDFKEHTRIQDNLTVEVVTAWCEQCGKYLSWLNQTNRYDAANHLIPNSKDVITADWYNACSKLCGLNTIVIKDKTRITAQLFKILGEKVSPN